jgi:ketosteroid isomerase-like protein
MRDSEQTATLREAEDVAALHRLNTLCICALARSDAAWFSEYLSDDFFCTLPDGRRVGKIEYLRRIEDSHGTRGVTFDEIDVRPLGDVAVVQGVVHSASDDSSASDRYTHVWQLRNGRWRAVVAHITRVVGSCSATDSRREVSRL